MQSNYQAITDENIRRFGTAIDEYGPQLLADRYSDRTHFVYELLQNAEDAIGWRQSSEKDFQQAVAFRLTHDALYFRHSGLPFSEEHVRGICNIGKGTKRQDLTAIGKHGIGFKSVYAYTHHPEVHSGNEHFVIESFVRPRAIAPKATARDETLFFLPFDHPEITPGMAYMEILERLHLLGLRTLLFLRQISSIQWETVDGDRGEYLREARQLDHGIEHVTLMGQKGNDLEPVEEHWLLLRKDVFHDEQPAGCVEVAFELNVKTSEESHTERIIRVSESPLVVFFPTEKETHLGFLVQGPYRTTPSRDNVPKDDRWNQHLVTCTAELVTESLQMLRRSGHLTADALEAFVVDPEKFEGQSQAAMFRPIASAIIESLESRPLIPRHKSGFVPAASARLARAANLRTLVNSKQLTFICNAADAVYWITGSITRERTPRLHTFLTNVLKVEEIDAESLVRRMSEPFLKAQTDEWVRNLYVFLHDQHALRRQAWFNMKPLIRLSTNLHVPPTDVSGAPNAYLPSKRRSGFQTVKKSVCSSDLALKFLQLLGLKEPDPVDDVIVNVLCRYTEQTDEVPLQYHDDVERIIEAYQTDSVRRRTDLLEALKHAWWIPCRNAESEEAILGIAEHNTYLPTKKLVSLFSGNIDVWFVDRSRPAMQGKVCQSILNACGVAEFLQRSKCKCDLSRWKLEAIRRNAGLQRETNRNLTDYTIEGLDTLLEQIASGEGAWQERSFVLWDCLHDAIRNYRAAFLFGEYHWSFNRDSRTVRIPAQFVRMLRQHAWLPGKDNEPRKPSQISFSDLPPEYLEGANETLVSLLEFKPDELRELAEKTGIDTAILDLIREHGLTLAELQSRLGIGESGKAKDALKSEKVGEGELTDEVVYANSDDLLHDGESKPTDEGNDRGDVDANVEEDNNGSAPTSSGQSHSVGSGERRPTGAVGIAGGGSARTGSAGTGARERRGQGSNRENGEGGSRGHTAEDREGIIRRILRQLEQATSTGVAPTDGDSFPDLTSSRRFQSDAKFRNAVVAYEHSRGRIPQLKEETAEGHDIDSYIREKGSLGRKLIRRIEVKGKGVPWTSGEIVELSDRQFGDAANLRVEEGVTLAADFDYWLYVVEEDGDGDLTVLPIRNPARRAAHYEFRGGTWRHLAEVEPIVSLESDESINSKFGE